MQDRWVPSAGFEPAHADPYNVDPTDLRDIPVIGSVFEGRWSSVPEQLRPDLAQRSPSLTVLSGEGHDAHGHGHGCSYEVARHLAAARRRLNGPAA